MSDTRLDVATLANAVQLAARAPSLHNTQPWRLIAEDGELKLFLDPSRVVRSTDRSSREAVMSCGVLLDHLRVALAAAGWDTEVQRFPNPNDRDHLATLSFRPLQFVTEGHRKRADAILARRTDRLPMSAYVDWDAFETLLRARLDDGPVHMDTLGEDVREEVAEAAALTESLRLYDAAYHSELTWWTTPFATEDGIPQTALISAEESERVAVSRDFPVAPHSSRRSALNNDAATIVVLSTDGYSREDALDAGEGLSKVLLECTMSGLATCPVTHVTELHASRDIIGRLIVRDACPQVLVRIGLAPALDEVPPPTPRRPVDAFLEVRPRS
ncbi:NAD(P)H nitroreductase [Mycolicibacterium smegmatis]|uniref:Acg family FMN-binding oxidoreductase n=1 Tax=Mycolicibacterium smegmatis TaxID=1772 RepID=UPI001E61C4CA|nr:NAD(P)H nitroreductase [Mycolicibacterium smegmatis]UGU34097.1 NAD(P)H nitroreductase [Mycolicibacterium smegmatis]ULN68938.1 NAD(P)H nitroreductase [Mycolicibacterium smegmatis]